MMETHCDYSRLIVPNSRAYIPVACAYVGQAATRLGFDETDREMIERALSEAISNVIEHAFEPSEKASLEISCERAPLGLKIVVRDQGLPLDTQQIESNLNESIFRSAHGPAISAMKEFMDEVEFHNLGPKGNETYSSSIFGAQA